MLAVRILPVALFGRIRALKRREVTGRNCLGTHNLRNSCSRRTGPQGSDKSLYQHSPKCAPSLLRDAHGYDPAFAGRPTPGPIPLS